MATLLFNFMTDHVIRDLFHIDRTGRRYSSTIKHPSVDNINLDLFVDGLHDKLARIFCLVDRQRGTDITLPCHLTVEEDDLFGLVSKNQPLGVADNETIMHYFKKYVITVSVNPLFENINQHELRIKDIFKYFFNITDSSLLDPADTSGENFIKQLRKKTNDHTITLPFEAEANNRRFEPLSRHTYSMCGDKLLYAYILRLYPTRNFPGNPTDPWSAGPPNVHPRNVTDRHIVILNFVWQCTLAYIQAISMNDARFPAGSTDHNPNFPRENEINTALGVLQQIQFVDFILQSPGYSGTENNNDYRHYTYANAKFIFPGDEPADAAPFAVSQGIAAECINELYPPPPGQQARVALPREGAPHQYKVQCKAKLQQYINAYTVGGPGGRGLSEYEKSIIYVLLKFAGDTSHIVNYMLFKYAIEGRRLGQGAQEVIPQVGQLKTTIFCCERALIARCIQENHSFYCRDVKVLAKEVPLPLGYCYYFNVNHNETYIIKRSLLESFRASAGGLQGEIGTAIDNLSAFIYNGIAINPAANEQIEQLITFINFYKAYMMFKAFITNSRNKYDEFVRTIIPSQFRVQTRIGRIRTVLNICTPLSSLFESLRKKKTFEKASLMSSAYYAPLVSILTELNNPNQHIIDKITRMGLNNDIIETLQTIVRYFTSRINIRVLGDNVSDEDIRNILTPDNNRNDTKLTELIINIIKCQREIDRNIETTINLIPPILEGGDGDGVMYDNSHDDPPKTIVNKNGKTMNKSHIKKSKFDVLVEDYINMNDKERNNIGYSYIQLARDVLEIFKKEKQKGKTFFKDLCLLFGINNETELQLCVQKYIIDQILYKDNQQPQQQQQSLTKMNTSMHRPIPVILKSHMVQPSQQPIRADFPHMAQQFQQPISVSSGGAQQAQIHRVAVDTMIHAIRATNIEQAYAQVMEHLQTNDDNNENTRRIREAYDHFNTLMQEYVPNTEQLRLAYYNLMVQFNLPNTQHILEVYRSLINFVEEKMFRFKLFIEYLASMVDHQTILNIISVSEQENRTELGQYIGSANFQQNIVQARAQIHHNGIYENYSEELEDPLGGRELTQDNILNEYEQEVENGIPGVPVVVHPNIPNLNEVIHEEPYYNLRKRRIPRAPIPAAVAATGIRGINTRRKVRVTLHGGGKNIRSISKMYRNNNKNVKKVKKTRKIKKNNYKKSKTSKKMTKTSVQNKKYIKSKGIKNMKNTKNKKVNKSKTKKSKKN